MKAHRAAAALIPALLYLAPAAFASPPATPPRDVPAQSRADRATDLAERERTLKAEEERLLALRKEVDEKIAKYEKLLGQAEAKEKRRQDEEDAKVDRLVKLFEGMAPEGAAPRLAALDDGMAAVILSRMKGRKASTVISAMDPKRAAVLLRKMAGGMKNFPPE